MDNKEINKEVMDVCEMFADAFKRDMKRNIENAMKQTLEDKLALFSVSVTESKSCHVCGTTEYYITDDGHKACKKHRCYLTSGKN